jgi:hypothetical protein
MNISQQKSKSRAIFNARQKIAKQRLQMPPIVIFWLARALGGKAFEWFQLLGYKSPGL